MGLFFTALSLLSLRRAVESNRAAWWAAYFISTLCVCYLTLLGASMILGFVPLVVMTRSWRRICTWIVGISLVLVLAVPVIVLSHRQRGIQSWITAVPWPSVPDVWGSTTLTPTLTWVVVGVSLATSAIPRRDAVLIGCALLAVPVCLTLASLTFQPVLLERYLDPAVVPLAVLGGVSLASLRNRAALAALVAGLVLVTLPGRIHNARLPGYGADFQAAAQVIGENARPGDAIVYGDWGPYRYGVGHYLRSGPADVMQAATASAMGTLYASQKPDSEIPAAVAGHARVWYAPPGTVYPRGDALASLYAKTTQFSVPGFTVTLYRH